MWRVWRSTLATWSWRSVHQEAPSPVRLHLDPSRPIPVRCEHLHSAQPPSTVFPCHRHLRTRQSLGPLHSIWTGWLPQFVQAAVSMAVQWGAYYDFIRGGESRPIVRRSTISILLIHHGLGSASSKRSRLEQPRYSPQEHAARTCILPQLHIRS